MDDDPGFFEAFDTVLTPLLEHEALAGLVGGLHSSGALAALLGTVARDRVAPTLGLAEPVAESVVAALLTHQVLEEDPHGGLRLTPLWRALVADDAYSDLGDNLRTGLIMGRLLAGIGAGDYWSMPPDDRLVLARAVSPNPYAAGLVAAFRADIAGDPDRADLLTGCRLLELGCGVAGRILTTLQAAPGLTAVGVELSPDLAAEAARRAAELGLSDRFSVVCGDAGDYTTEEPFDRAFWSQFFFPVESRPGALAALHAALRSRGIATAPLAGDEPGDALFRVMLASWGVPLRTADELMAEVEAAGFTEVEVVGVGEPGPSSVRFRRP
ncbi:SAM-dependent methyltransferase [Nocardioides cynanchi]|uniref:SAM-dependent methyltransferase n=1 Tax=Nocardioides cynanchi TaxID=2558918 RepID=UPI0012479F97|nr:class I SAM-dependent methyltransferase [Nocardioides cynanchi]